MNNTNDEQLNNGINQGNSTVENPISMDREQPVAAPTPAPTPVVEAPAAQPAPVPTPVVEAPAVPQAPVQPEVQPTVEMPAVSENVQPAVVPEAIPATENNESMNHVETVGSVDKDYIDTSQLQNTVSLDTLRNTKKDNKEIVGGDGKNSKKAPLFISLFIVLLLIIGFGYYFLMISPKSIYGNIINTIYNKLDELVKSDNGLRVIYAENKLNANITKPNHTILNPIKVDWNIGYDFNKTRALSELKLGIANKDLLEFNNYTTNDSEYYKFAEQYVKYPLVDSNGVVKYTQGITPEDWMYIVSEFKKLLVEKPTEDLITRKFESNEINGLIIMGINVSYEITPDEAAMMFDALANQTINDDKLLTLVSQYSGYSKQEMKYMIQQMIGKVKPSETIKLSTFINLAGTQIKKVEVTYKDFVFKYEGHNEKYMLLIDGNLNVANEPVKVDVDLELNIEELIIAGKVVVTYKNNQHTLNINTDLTVEYDKHMDVLFDTKLEYFEPNATKNSLEMNIKSDVKALDEVPFPEMTNVVDYATLSPEEKAHFDSMFPSLDSLMQFMN